MTTRSPAVLRKRCQSIFKVKIIINLIYDNITQSISIVFNINSENHLQLSNKRNPADSCCFVFGVTVWRYVSVRWARSPAKKHCSWNKVRDSKRVVMKIWKIRTIQTFFIFGEWMNGSFLTDSSLLNSRSLSWPSEFSSPYMRFLPKIMQHKVPKTTSPSFQY